MQHDFETGIDYFYARYYNRAEGRFLSADLPFIDQHPGDPQSWNLYGYVRNSPLIFVDLSGN
jgi:RHS repeat-associated protein